MTFKSSS